jgi:hypothetical protein
MRPIVSFEIDSIWKLPNRLNALPQPTPPFLLWSLRYDCRLREEATSNFGIPLWRQLSPLQAFSDCRAEGRVFEGIALAAVSDFACEPQETPPGFLIDEVLAYYGGEAAVDGLCHGCPANATHPDVPLAVACCCGILADNATQIPLHQLVSQIVEQSTKPADSSDVSSVFQATNPSWYGLWLETPLVAQRLRLLEPIFAEAYASATGQGIFVGDGARQLATFLSAMRRALAHNLFLDVELFPSGYTTAEKDWYVDSHCYRCQAVMDAEAKSCDVCQRQGGPHPQLRRRARGNRPFRPLAGLLGQQVATEWFARFLQQRKSDS